MLISFLIINLTEQGSDWCPQRRPVWDYLPSAHLLSLLQDTKLWNSEWGVWRDSATLSWEGWAQFVQISDSAGTARYSSGRSSLKWEVCVWVVLLPLPALLMRQSCHFLEKTMCLHGWGQCSVCGALPTSTKDSADFANVTVQTEFPAVKADQFLPATFLDIFECLFPS